MLVAHATDKRYNVQFLSCVESAARGARSLCSDELVVDHTDYDGERRLSLRRAFAVVNRQWMVV